ncbi:class I SAM-dependent methyltransferase [Cognatishimia maritima]|uniref:Methyltransferase domain-containing protein n=1 Tax=Cognatishimia maritima TaxID=870908 RepID=A0A1M5WEI4_9RHOB|nr:class I SAM-dependent methyltransferase [Cognatishimia maritima]SHH85634.1 Methyltransferase domain-containing protein [Cognatishimia maritima]
MDRGVYDRMNALEAEHWWFVARRRIIETAIRQFVPLGPSPRILEAGVGTGGNIAMLQQFGDLQGFEFDAPARDMATAKTGLSVPYGALPDDIPFSDGRFDLICLFDVLEHVEPDAESLAALAQKLAPGGRIFVTVPAYPWLWSEHDVSHHHFRRYTRKSLAQAAQSAGLTVERFFNFNVFLMPLILGVRLVKRLLGSKASDDVMPGPGLNRVLGRVFAAERHLIGRTPMPAGVSLGAVLMRNA